MQLQGHKRPRSNATPLDYYIEQSQLGGTYKAYKRKGLLKETSDDIGTLVNEMLSSNYMDGVGQLGIDGSVPTQYEAATTINAVGVGSILEYMLDIIGYGEMPQILADDGVTIIDMTKGVNLNLERLLLEMPSSGAAVPAILGSETAAEGAYLENSLMQGRIKDVKTIGGAAGAHLWDITMPEWFEIAGRNYIVGNAGVNGAIFRITDTAEFNYCESNMPGMLEINLLGPNVTNLEFLGTANKMLQGLNWRGLLWLRNRSDSDGTIALKASRLYNSRIEGIKFENVDRGVVIGAPCEAVSLEGYDAYCTLALNNGSNLTFFDLDYGYGIKLAKFMSYGGAKVGTVWIDDENDDGNAPNGYRDMSIKMVNPGEMTMDLGTHATKEDIGSGPLPYYKFGNGASYP